METANMLQNGVGTDSTVLKTNLGLSNLLSSQSRKALVQNKTVLSPCCHLTSVASPLSFLLHKPVGLKHAMWDKED